MNRRTQQIRLTLGLPRFAANLALVGLAALAISGCGAPSSAPAPDPARMNHDQLSVYGDDLQIQGRKLRDQGIANGDNAMKQRGQAMIVQGQQLIDRSTAMTDQPQQSGPIQGISHSPY
jgi:hypothetical protein